MKYLLDSNVWIAILRGRHPEIERRRQATDADKIRTCSVVVAELRLGCLRSANPKANRTLVDELFAPIMSLPFDDAAAEHFARIRHFLEKSGTPVGPYDMQIAAIALAHDCTVVTHNAADFGKMPGLVVEDWQKD